MKNILKTPIVDLHADVLSYLADDTKRTAYDAASRASISQLAQGGVVLQVLPIFTITKKSSVAYGANQVGCFKDLLKITSVFSSVRTKDDLENLETTDKIALMPAIENASGFCSEDEELSRGIERLDAIIAEIGPLFYVSLTWNGANRFGGGTGVDTGLTQDGRILVEALIKRNITIDLSHASDPLAADILELLPIRKGAAQVIASHSNFRSVCDVPRNLPDQVARGIFERGGIVGCNSVFDFLGSEKIDKLADHLRHGISLGGIQGMALGADFFCEKDIPPTEQDPNDTPMFVPYWSDASYYQKVISSLTSEYKFTPEQIQAITFKNACRIIKNMFRQ